jgi:hypothetical protein
MITSLRIKYEGVVPGAPGQSEADFLACLREAWRQVGEYWHHELAPKHFTTAGGSEYGYLPRAGERGAAGKKGFAKSYTGRKLRKMGHTRPLAWSRESEQAVAQSTRVVPSPHGVRIEINAPNLEKRHNYSPINMPAEMTAVSQAERTLLAKLHGDYTERGLRAAARTATTTFS